MEVVERSLFHNGGHAVGRRERQHDDGRGVGVGAPPCAELPAPVGQLTVPEERDGLGGSGPSRKGEDGEGVIEELTVVRTGGGSVGAGEILEQVASGEFGGRESRSRHRHDQTADVSGRLFLIDDVCAQRVDGGLSSRCETGHRLTIGNQTENGVFCPRRASGDSAVRALQGV